MPQDAQGLHRTDVTREHAQASLETIGMTVVAAVAAVAVIGAASGGAGFGRALTGSVCRVTGDCAAAPAPGEQAPAASGPCTTSEAAAAGGVRSAAAVPAGPNRSVVVSQQSDATYQVRVTDGPGAGTSPAPVGLPHTGGISPGGADAADATASIPGGVTHVYSASTTADMRDAVNSARYDRVMDSSVSTGPTALTRPAMDWTAARLGLPSGSAQPVGTAHGGGDSTSAAARVAALVVGEGGDGASASGTPTVTEVQDNADGSSVVTVAGARDVAAVTDGLLGQSAGQGASLTSQYTLSPDGALSNVRTSVGQATGSGHTRVTVQDLPVTSPRDRSAAAAYVAGTTGLGSPAPGAAGLADAVRADGSQSRLTYRSGGPDSAESASLPAPVDLGINGSSAVPDARALDAQVWDGQGWSTWQGCAS